MLEWFQNLHTEVQVAIVALFSAITVTILPLLKGRTPPKERQAEIAGAIVDNGAILKLSDAIHRLVDEMESTRESNARNADRIGDELTRLREEMIRSGKRIDN